MRIFVLFWCCFYNNYLLSLLEFEKLDLDKYNFMKKLFVFWVSMFSWLRRIVIFLGRLVVCLVWKFNKCFRCVGSWKGVKFYNFFLVGLVNGGIIILKLWWYLLLLENVVCVIKVSFVLIFKVNKEEVCLVCLDKGVCRIKWFFLFFF